MFLFKFFWYPSGIQTYFINRMGLMIGFYYVMSVLLEYPTGVIGDYYSHRISVFFGYIILALSYVLLSLSGGILFYGATLFLLALGGSLVSGSDNALLHTVSNDFKKDYSQVKAYEIDPCRYIDEE